MTVKTKENFNLINMTQNTLNTTNAVLESRERNAGNRRSNYLTKLDISSGKTAEKIDAELLEELNEHLVRIENIPQKIIDSIIDGEEVSKDNLQSLVNALDNVDMNLEEYYDLVMTSILLEESK